MNKWTKKNTIKTIKTRANYNARMLVHYVTLAQDTTDKLDKQRNINMAKLYYYHLDEIINIYEDFDIIDFHKSSDLKDKLWNYYTKVFK